MSEDKKNSRKNEQYAYITEKICTYRAAEGIFDKLQEVFCIRKKISLE